eukprot:m.138787 g.138787  ORF g.138787 m.138787 type:complete len:66 (+) comp15923_c0_seq10:495-692(+)
MANKFSLVCPRFIVVDVDVLILRASDKQVVENRQRPHTTMLRIEGLDACQRIASPDTHFNPTRGI